MYKTIEVFIVSICYLLVSGFYFHEVVNKEINEFIGVLSTFVVFIITIFYIRYLVKSIFKSLKF
jgi:hypothetical protein